MDHWEGKGRWYPRIWRNGHRGYPGFGQMPIKNPWKGPADLFEMKKNHEIGCPNIANLKAYEPQCKPAIVKLK